MHAGAGFRARSLTVAGLLVAPVALGTLDIARGWLKSLCIEEVPLGLDAATRLASLRAQTRLKLPGCCVLLAAQDAGADTIATFDDRLGAAVEGLDLSLA